MSDLMSLIEAVHELRRTRGTDVQTAISQSIDILATGQAPPAGGVIEGAPAKLPPAWWFSGTIEYPNSTAAFRIIDPPGSSAEYRTAVDTDEALARSTRVIRATDVSVDRVAWQRALHSEEHSGTLAPKIDAPPISASEVSKSKRGRKPGSGTMDDSAALRRMLHLLATGTAPSVLAAAKTVAAEKRPSHSADADIARLRKKFATRWRTEPPQGQTWADVIRSVGGELNSNSPTK
jgi:hypothetical protein